MPEHLCPACRTAKTKMDHSVRSMRKCLKPIAFDHSRSDRRRHGHPASRRTAQLFHDPEISLFHATDKIQMKGMRIVTLFRQSRNRIIIIRAKVQFGKQFIEIRHALAKPCIGGNRCIRKIFPEKFCLKLHVVHCAHRHEPLIIKQIRRIILRDRKVPQRRMYL